VVLGLLCCLVDLAGEKACHAVGRAIDLFMRAWARPLWCSSGAAQWDGPGRASFLGSFLARKPGGGLPAPWSRLTFAFAVAAVALCGASGTPVGVRAIFVGRNVRACSCACLNPGQHLCPWNIVSVSSYLLSRATLKRDGSALRLRAATEYSVGGPFRSRPVFFRLRKLFRCSTGRHGGSTQPGGVGLACRPAAAPSRPRPGVYVLRHRWRSMIAACHFTSGPGRLDEGSLRRPVVAFLLSVAENSRLCLGLRLLVGLLSTL